MGDKLGPAVEWAKSYSLLIAQGSSFCNIDCRYCYLWDRGRHRLMDVTVAHAIAEGIADQDGDHVRVAWHGGEALTTGRARFQELLEPFEDLRHRQKVSHNIQTNATLIDERWCDLFERYDVSIGVSIDGPAALNVNRRDRGGRETFDRAMRGITRLKAAGISFSVIAVVTEDTIERTDELFAFLEELGPKHVGFNIEEREGVNATRALVHESAAELFWSRVIRHLDGSRLRVREIARVADYLHSRAARREFIRARERVPTVSATGDVVVLSPELAGTPAPEYNNFVVGNLLTTPLSEILSHVDGVRYVREFAEGLAGCQASCSFWDFCKGAFASNRFFEHGRFTATETAMCRNSRQAPIRAVRAAIDAEAKTDRTRTFARLLDELAAPPDR
jgi:uncharacterized protein